MARAILINDREWERDYKIASGRIITLKLDEDWSQITFWENGKQLGNDLDFIFVESDFGDSPYLLGRMYIPIKKSGLGRAAIEFFTETTGYSVYCRSDDGIVREDGSHLTEDAPAFVSKMIKEGLILDNEADEYLDMDY